MYKYMLINQHQEIDMNKWDEHESRNYDTSKEKTKEDESSFPGESVGLTRKLQFRESSSQLILGETNEPFVLF